MASPGRTEAVMSLLPVPRFRYFLRTSLLSEFHDAKLRGIVVGRKSPCPAMRLQRIRICNGDTQCATVMRSWSAWECCRGMRTRSSHRIQTQHCVHRMKHPQMTRGSRLHLTMDCRQAENDFMIKFQKRICIHCGAEFMPRRKWAKFCSKKCQWNSWAERNPRIKIGGNAK